MTKPNRERWHRIERLADAAIDVPREERAAWLLDACDGDPSLRDEVLRLLDAGERDDSFLAAPLAAVGPALSVETPKAASVPGTIGPYRVLREIGRGGMGVVYLAEREAHFEQRVALKLVRSGLPADEHLLQRFLEERKILASLEHANIARLLDGGVTPDGAHWFAMEFVDGEPIDRWCDARQLSLDDRLELFCTLCDAVEYAHARQIVHRDIKPTNVLVRADGTLKLLDFGIAKLLVDELTSAAGLTHTGGRLLTPEYASPEQVRGDPVSPATDVYSLGAVLYELLTGRRPYRVAGRSRVDLERAVLEQTPTRPSAAVPSADRGARLRGALDDITLRALAKHPNDRYTSARGLATDVRRYLRGEAVRVNARSPRARRTVVLLGLVATSSAAILFASRLADRPPAAGQDTLPVTAVGLVTDYRDSVRSGIARSLADLLATNLARVPRLPVVSTARLYEVMAQLAPNDVDDAGAYSAAARRAGASTLIDGGLYRVASDSLRLELRRIELATGNVVAAFTITGGDIFTLVDRATTRLAADLGSAAPEGAVADVTTHSEVAARFYEEGLRAYYYGDVSGSRRLFQAALAQDSALAMAEHYLAQVLTGSEVVRQHMQRALRLAERASDRERLIIRSFWMLYTADPAAIATAETLSVRFPQELEGARLAGKALIEAGDYAAAIRRLREVIVRDSLALRGAASRCSACEAWYDLVGVYMLMDSLDVAEREARRATSVRRVSALALIRLADVLLARGDVRQAQEVYSRATQIDPTLTGNPSYFTYFYLPADDYETADRSLREIAQAGSPERRSEANWHLTISLRNQGRLREALETAQTHRRQALAVGVSGPSPQVAFQEAQVLFELGRHREAASLFDSIAAAPPGFTPSHQARHRTWALTHAATSVFAAGDTSSLRERVETIRVVGSRSLLARDQRLHHYARGLLLVSRGQDVAAVEEFRRAAVSPIIGFTRIQYELGRALLRLGRASEAAQTLRPTVHGPLDGSNLYVTHTELRELLGLAWDRAGARDSALIQYGRVLRAWQRADPALGARVAAVRARVATLDGADALGRR